MIFILIIAIVAVLALVLISLNAHASTQVIERREAYVRTLGNNLRTVVNNGTWLFYAATDGKMFGFDESTPPCRAQDLCSFSVIRGTVSIYQSVSPNRITVGSHTAPLTKEQTKAICDVLYPIMRQKLQEQLAQRDIHPDKEFAHNGAIWGCDTKKKILYTTQHGISFYRFCDLLSVTVDDGREGAYKVAAKRIHPVVRAAYPEGEAFEYDLYFYDVDATYYDLVAMFKEIRAHRR